MFEPWWQRLPLRMSDNPGGTAGGEGTNGGDTGTAGGEDANGGDGGTGGNDTQPADGGNDTQPADTEDKKSPADKLTEQSSDDEEGTEEDGEDKPLELAAPEGFEADQDKLTAFTEEATELGLTQEQAQGVLDYYAKAMKDAIDGEASAFADRVNGWQKALEADKDLGGDKLDENLGIAALTLKTFATDGFIKLLNPPSEDNPEGLGLGNHPDVVRFFHAIGTRLSDDTLVKGGKDANEPEPLDLVGALYGPEAQKGTQ